MAQTEGNFEFEADIAILETLIRDYWISKKKKNGEYQIMYEDIVRLVHSMALRYKMKIRITKGGAIC